MTRRRHFALRLIGTGAALIVAIWLATLAGILVVGSRDEAQPSAAIVVLGAAQYAGHPSPVLKARLDHGVALFKRGLAPLLIVTGGRGDGDTTSEAAVSRRYVRQLGVPDSAIALERHGRTTSESMHAVARYLEAEHNRSVILVSDPFHMLRLTIVARRLGLIPHGSPTRTSPIAANPGLRWRYVLGESVKVPAAFILERK
ncbi:MAG TPA: YdcF family protein [Gemmatimonadaceae bacterium]|nr:YdcF family protein [Gemmatimonadaceae bacterium]